MKKWIATLLGAVVSLCVFAGCGGDGSKTTGKAPTYDEEKTMLIGGWDSPPPTEEAYGYARDMGITLMYVDRNIGWGDMGTQGYFDTLKLCEKMGMKAMLSVNNNFNTVDYNVPDGTDYSEYPAVIGINYFDEPFAMHFDFMMEQLAAHNAMYDGKNVDYYANLNPNFVVANPRLGFDTYEEYVDAYCKEILQNVKGKKWLSVDFYPLLDTLEGPQIATGWLPNLELFAAKVAEYGVDYFNFFIQGTQIGSNRAVAEEDLRFQFWVNMSYGANVITYFTYRQSRIIDYRESFVDLNGIPSTDVYKMKYEGAQRVNREFLAMDDTFLSFKWKELMTVTGANVDESEKDEKGESVFFTNLGRSVDMVAPLKAVSATENTLVSAFKDGEGRDGLIVTNFTDPYYAVDDSVELEFKEKTDRLIVWKNGEKKTYEVKDNKFKLDLAGGEGAFLIPYLA